MNTSCLLANRRESRVETALRRRLQRDLATATQSSIFLLLFQPRIDLRSGRASGAEALVRWPHRQRGLVAASAFVPLAEASGQIVEIGGWALLHACQTAAGWPDEHTVSVNVSGRQLISPGLLQQIAAALEQSGLRAERLELEITEAVLTEPGEDALLVLAALRDLGIGVALDDFGENLASLSMLRRMPLTSVKLSRALVRDLPHDDEATVLAESITTVGHALGLTVVADGVETAGQRDALASTGCDAAQGYLFGHPVADTEIALRLTG